jgi:lipopolysaccharide assembly outer membrane protein LptD (OstA)
MNIFLRFINFIFVFLIFIPLYSQTGLDTLKTKNNPKTSLGNIISQPNKSDSISDLAQKDSINKKTKSQDLTDTVFYSAEGGYIDYDVEKKTLYLIGNGIIRYQDISLFADTITYYIDDGIVQATGKPQLVEKNDTTIGEAMIYNIKTKRGRVKYASAHMADAFFNGGKIIKTEKNELYIEHGDYTTCNQIDTPHYYFYGKTVKVIPEDKIISKPVVLAIADAPVAALPYFIFPLERKRQSGLLTPIWGGHPESGGYLDNIGYYFAPNDYMDFTTWARIQEFKDYVLNISSRYSLKYWLNGYLTARYATSGDFMKKSNQWSIEYSHNQKLSPDGNFTLQGSGNLIGTQSFYRYFSEDSMMILNQTTKANLALTKMLPSINGSMSLSWQRDQNLSNGAVTENIPSLNFNLPSRALIPNKTGKEANWYNNIFYTYSASGLIKHTITPSDTGQDMYRKAGTQTLNLSSPQKIFKYFTIDPYFNTQLSVFDMCLDTSAYDTAVILDTVFDTLSLIELYQKSITPNIIDTLLIFNRSTQMYDTNFRIVNKVDTIKKPLFHSFDKLGYDFSWKTGLNLSTILYGIFPIRIFNFMGIRHTLTPTISYNFIPSHNQKYKFYNIVPYESGRKKQSQTIGINISNEFQGKIIEKPKSYNEKPVENKFQILSANMSLSYDFEAEKRKFSDLLISASTSYNILRVTYNSSFWMYDMSDNLHVPILYNYSFSVSPSTSLSAKGSFWNGEKINLDSLQIKTGLSDNNLSSNQWQASISPSYTFSQRRNAPNEPFITTKQYSLSVSASCNFARNWSVSWGSTYNFIANQFVNHDIHFMYDQDCWQMRFDWRPGGYNPGYYFLINIKKIPEIKWEQRG